MSPIFLHLPHDSLVIPPKERADFLLNDGELRHELLRLTDWHTTALYAATADPEDVVPAEVSRLVVDVERFPDDQDEPCAKVGMGATYVSTCDGRPLRVLSAVRRAELLERYYWPHHRRLDEAAADRLARFGRCVILDAHSFPGRALPTQVDFSAPPEIGIGTEREHTAPALRQLVEAFFKERGYRTGLDVPFRGALVPNRFFGRDPRVQSVMVEVRRDLYMDEATGDRHAGFARVQADLAELRGRLRAFAEEADSPAWGG
jgi:N-formylglutamate amidohydrolase